MATAEEAQEALAKRAGGYGIYYDLGEEVDTFLRNHPVSKKEKGQPRGYDDIHLSAIGKTNLIRWMGRRSDGMFHQIGDVMKLIKL